MEENKNKEGQLNIELDQEIAEGTYSNLAIINHSMSEFIVDFINIMPGVSQSKSEVKNYFNPPARKKINKSIGRQCEKV